MWYDVAYCGVGWYGVAYGGMMWYDVAYGGSSYLPLRLMEPVLHQPLPLGDLVGGEPGAKVVPGKALRVGG